MQGDMLMGLLHIFEYMYKLAANYTKLHIFVHTY